MKSKNTTVARRDQFVVKANDLVRARYRLTVQQQKIVLYVISLIKPDDAYDTKYTLTIRDLCAVCGLSLSGYYYAAIKKDLHTLTNREWGVFPDGSEGTVSWLGDVKLSECSETGQVTVTLNPNLAPYLFELRGNYTQYRLKQALVFKHGAAIRLYELMRSYTTQTKLDNGADAAVTIELDQLRDMLSETKYTDWRDFHKWVLKPAVDEINERSDELHIDYTPNKYGKRIVSVSFVIGRASNAQIISAHQKARERDI